MTQKLQHHLHIPHGIFLPGENFLQLLFWSSMSIQLGRYTECNFFNASIAGGIKELHLVISLSSYSSTMTHLLQMPILNCELHSATTWKIYN